MIDRRLFLSSAAAFGAQAVWAAGRRIAPRHRWTETRALYPQGVASGDPDHHSVLLWTRRPFAGGDSGSLVLQVAEDEGFDRLVVERAVTVEASADWTCRVLVGGLSARTVYWYRFADGKGGSRIGRTITAPLPDDEAAVRFAFVSCQNANQGAQNAYRRMIHEDGLAASDRQLGFVLHLGDFIYEVVWYPEDRPQGYLDRRIREVVRYPNGEKIRDFHIPTTVEDYRAAYRGYLADIDIQDARARWPFVAMWDNHEFSQNGWQSFQEFGGTRRPAQTRKVAANQAWFEYQPARVTRGGKPLDRFAAPVVADAPIIRFDDAGLGLEPNNLQALASLTGFRAVRWGANVELIVTDQRGYRSEEAFGDRGNDAFSSDAYLDMVPEEAMRIIDAGRMFDGGAPATIKFGYQQKVNYRKDAPAQTILGAEQKAWFLDRLARSTATWKVWGNTLGTLDWRADPQHLPAPAGEAWPGAGYAAIDTGDFGGAFAERGEIYDFVRGKGITGMVTLSGDRHAFWAGVSAKALPPARFDPVGLAFVVGSISAPGFVEAEEHRLKKDHPLRALYMIDRPGRATPEPSVNLLTRYGVRTCLEYARSGDLAQAQAARDPALAPHLSFVDLGGHGYGVVTASATRWDTEFICIPRPLERATAADGGPIRYRVTHGASLWAAGEAPTLTRGAVEGDLGLSA